MGHSDKHSLVTLVTVHIDIHRFINCGPKGLQSQHGCHLNPKASTISIKLSLT